MSINGSVKNVQPVLDDIEFIPNKVGIVPVQYLEIKSPARMPRKACSTEWNQIVYTDILDRLLHDAEKHTSAFEAFVYAKAM